MTLKFSLKLINSCSGCVTNAFTCACSSFAQLSMNRGTQVLVWSCSRFSTSNWESFLATVFLLGVLPSKYFFFCLLSQQISFPHVSRTIKRFLGKSVRSLGVLFGQWISAWNSPMDTIFAQSLSHHWVMNLDLNWGQQSLLPFRCCSGFFCDLLDESSLETFWQADHSWERSSLFPVFSVCWLHLQLWLTGVPKL